MPRVSTSGSVLSLGYNSGVAGPRGKPCVVAKGTPRTPRGPPPRGPTSPGSAIHSKTSNPSMYHGTGSNNGSRRTLSAAGSAFSSTSRAPMPTIDEDAAQLADQLSRLNVRGTSRQAGRTYDPSNAPAPSQMTLQTKAFSTVRSNASGVSRRGPFKSEFCTLTGRSRRDFCKGEIISLPHHVINCNPNVDLSDPNLTLTKYGGVYSKRRMFIVLTTNTETMLCIPMFTYNKRGLLSRPKHVRHEYLMMANADDTDFQSELNHIPVEAKCRYPLDKDSTIHLGDVVKVGYRDDILKVGNVVPESYERLAHTWRNFMNDAFKVR